MFLNTKNRLPLPKSFATIRRMNEQPPSLPQACCLNCVFLRDVDGTGTPLPSLGQELRNSLKEGHPIGKRNLGCYRGIWGKKTVVDQPDSELAEFLTRDQDDRCLFYPYALDLCPGPARQLEQRAADRREAERDRALTRDEAAKDRKLTRWAVIFAGVAATSSLIVGVAGLRGCHAEPPAQQLSAPEHAAHPISAPQQPSAP
jgi:hypothetical protein